MDWYQLRYLQTLSRTMNFTKAADELAISQPALSRAIARLEDELGVPLFERTNRGVTLSRYGEIFLQYVNRAIQEIERGEQELKNMVDPKNGIISLGFIYTLGSSFVPNLINTFRKREPGIQFKLVEESTMRLLHRLRASEIDLAFCSPQEDFDDISTVPILDEELYLIVPKSHRLAHRHEIRLSEVANEPFVLYKPESGLREIIERYCEQTGFKPHISFEGVEDKTIAGLVAADLGVAIIPLIPGLDLDKISLLRISDPQCRRVVYMVWRRNAYMPPAVKKFKEFVEAKQGLTN